MAMRPRPGPGGRQAAPATGVIASTPHARSVARPPLAAVGLIACGGFAVLHALFYWPHTIDDAYIGFRFSRNFALGHGWVFNPGGPVVEGFSSPTWVWGTGLAIRAGLRDVALAAKLAGIVCFVATVIATGRLVRAIAGDATPAELVAPLLVATNAYLAYHAVSGLETALVVLLIAETGVAALRLGAGDSVRAAWFSILLVAVTATRAEGFGYAAGFIAAAAWLHHGGRAGRRRVAGAALGWLVAWGGLIAWRWVTFGALLPTTATAKVVAPLGHASHWPGVQYVGRFLAGQSLGTDGLLSAAAAALLVRHGGRRDAIVLVPLACATVFVVVVRGDWMHSFRFMTPVVPYLAVAVARASSELLRRGTPRPALAAGALLLVVVVAQQVTTDRAMSTFGMFSRGRKPFAWPLLVAGRVRRGFDGPLPGPTRWALENLRDGQVLATGDIGFPAWAADETVLDLRGLTDPTLARAVPTHDHAAFAAYLGGRAPEYVLVRTSRGVPALDYDQLMVASGLLDRYEPVAHIDTWGVDTEATMWRRRDGVVPADPASVLDRYDRAIRWNPRVPALREWRAAYVTGLRRTARRPPAGGPAVRAEKPAAGRSAGSSRIPASSLDVGTWPDT